MTRPGERGQRIGTLFGAAPGSKTIIAFKSSLFIPMHDKYRII
jgi:hypothetical protein